MISLPKSCLNGRNLTYTSHQPLTRMKSKKGLSKISFLPTWEPLTLATKAIRSQILASAEMPSFDDVVARIEQEQSRRSLMNSHQAETTENQALKTLHTPNPNPRGPAKTKGAAATDWCDHCKRARHNREGCWVLHPHLRSVRNRGVGRQKIRRKIQRLEQGARMGV
jgi:hypothetical protein